MEVLAIYRYPVKAMLGQPLERVAIGPGGCEGDRRYVVVDVATGRRIANKRGPTDPRLRACRARLRDGRLEITLPGGDTVASGLDDALSDLLERRVRLEECSAPARGRFGATGAFHDLAPVHLISTGTLAAFDADVRRFRPNLLVRFEGDEDALLGGTLHAASGLALDVGLPTPRCVVPTRAIEELPADPGLLRRIVAAHRIDLGPAGRQGCAGCYAEVLSPGAIAVGDRLSVRRSASARDDVIRDRLARVFA